jgi:uncharacterized protein (DUF342 family)
VSDSQNRQIVIPGKKNDGNVAVGFTRKDMEAWADFLPPGASGAPLTSRLIEMVLGRLNIIHGLRWDQIRQAMRECNNGRQPVKDVLIAKGEDPVNEITAFYAINPKVYFRPKIPKGNARVDYRSYTPFVIVKKDQILARLRPPKEGRPGMNVHGESLPFQTIQPAGVRGGENTRTEGDLIFSRINGQMLERGGVLDVKDTLVVKGPVGYATGNIIFPGDVYINGPVSDGFKIYSGGSVTIRQTFDVTDTITRGNLKASGGIIGRGRGLLKIGGSLKAKFLENCRAAVRENVVVGRAIINSRVWTLESVEMENRGLVLGSEIYVQKKLRTGGIGRRNGKATRIYCGIDFTIEQEKEKNNRLIKILGTRIRELRDLIATEEEVGRRDKLLEGLNGMLEERQKAADKLAELLVKTVRNEDAVVEVSGEVVPGTFIEICQVGFLVTDPLCRVRFKLEKDLVITEPLC